MQIKKFEHVIAYSFSALHRLGNHIALQLREVNYKNRLVKTMHNYKLVTDKGVLMGYINTDRTSVPEQDEAYILIVKTHKFTNIKTASVLFRAVME